MNAVDDVDILLVDDSDHDAELTLRAFGLQPLNARVHHVFDGPEALDFLHGCGRYAGRAPVPPRLIVLDLCMPMMNGVEVLQAIRATHTLRTVPVVMMTSSDEPADIAAAYRWGANSYVTKPIDFGGFIRAAQTIGRYWFSLNESPLH